MDRGDLERLDRESLVLRAQAAGVRRARVLTRPELIDELLRLDPRVDDAQLKRTRGFFGRARDLLSRVVERGLHLPDAADRLRAALVPPLPNAPRPEPQAVPTVTLAEIYAAQGHRQRAIETLRRVLEAEPDHGAARALVEKLEAADYVPPRPPLPPENEEAPVVDEIGANLGLGAELAAPPAAPSVEPAQDGFEPAAAGSPPPVAPPMEPVVPGVGEERDECVAIPSGEGTLYVWWRLAPTSGALLTNGAGFVVRAVVIVPTWDGPRPSIRDVPVDAASGELVLRELPPGAIVRVAVGSATGGDFVPIAHSIALEQPPGDGAARGFVRRTLDGVSPIGSDEPVARAIARATEAAHDALRGS